MDAAGTVTERRGTKVRLRPVRADEYDTLAAARVEVPGGPPFDDARLRDRIEHSGGLHRGEVLLAVESVEDGRLVGEVQVRHPEHAFPPGVWELGIELYDRADRGRGLGREATWLMAALAFEELGAHRVQATTETSNRPMRTVFERLGFTFEGVLRGFWPVGEGPPLDYAMYAMTLQDYESKKEATPWTSND